MSMLYVVFGEGKISRLGPKKSRLLFLCRETHVLTSTHKNDFATFSKKVATKVVKSTAFSQASRPPLDF